MAQQRHEDSDDDTYVRVGSAFERLETEEDVQKAKARKDKESYVTDEQGRRRFHGAFTGGFSAGYFNTVGSKEGWTPSSFVSSRGKKADYSQQKPEDFMDQEDFGVHGIAPKAVATKEEFSQSNQQGIKRTASDVLHTVIPGAAALQGLVVPAHSTIGAKLLKALGWREGEGLGPKVMKYGPQQEMKVYGCYLQDETESHYLPKEAKGFMFAPKDITPWQFEGKDDLHGIDYSGMQEQSVLGSVKATRALYGMSGEAFGLGALEEEETEDDVYGVESMTSYDLTLAGEGDISMEQKYGWTGSHGTDIWGLSAFVKASKQSVPSKTYPPPSVPRDFVPLHKFSNSCSMIESQNDWQKPLTSTQRSQLLSDQPGSVFSLLSTKDREKLQRMSDSVKQVAAGQSESPTPKREIDLPPESSTKSISDNIKLFANDPAKHERYKAYLTGRDLQDGSNRTEWERQREREEFARTARVVEPLGSSLSTRFTRSQKEVTTEGSMEEEPESDAVQAAKADMFGILTRQVEEWHPHRVLCKRFNIPDPYPGSGLVGMATGKDEIKFSSRGSGSVRSISFMHTERLVPVEEPPDDEDGRLQPTQTQQNVSNTESTKSVGEAQSTSDQNVTSSTEAGESTEIPRPSLDLFKAIFAESSDESVVSSNESDEESTVTSTHKSPSNTTKLDSTTNQSRSQWQDFSTVTSQSLNTKIVPLSAPTLNQSYDSREMSDSAEHSRPTDQLVECYGPSLPPKIDQQEYTREPSPERKHKHKRSHKKRDSKMEHKKIRRKHSKHKR